MLICFDAFARGILPRMRALPGFAVGLAVGRVLDPLRSLDDVLVVQAGDFAVAQLQNRREDLVGVLSE